MSQDDMTALRELLNVHFGNITARLNQLAASYEEMNKNVGQLERNTDVAVTGIRKDIENNQARLKTMEGELAAVKSRIEINEDVQLGKWGDQEVHNDRMKNMRTILWTIFVMVLGMVLTLLWNMLLHGGLNGL